MMREMVLTGLDGSNPLGFLAALGVLCAAEDRARREDVPPPGLAWRDASRWTAVLHSPWDLDGLVSALDEDRRSWGDEPALQFAYTKEGERCRPDAKGAIRDLKPPPAVMRAFLAEMAERALQGDARSARHAAAYGTDVVVDGKGNTKPTSLHFTAGQQTFLGAASALRSVCDADRLREACFGPWRAFDGVRSLGWDPLGATSARPYALRASNPSDDKRPCVPGAEWLAFRGLGMLAVVPRRTEVRTPGVQGRWKSSTFTWPLWSGFIGGGVLTALLRTAGLPTLNAATRRARGIVAVFQAAIERSEQGGYGSFSPARAV